MSGQKNVLPREMEFLERYKTLCEVYRMQSDEEQSIFKKLSSFPRDLFQWLSG